MRRNRQPIHCSYIRSGDRPTKPLGWLQSRSLAITRQSMILVFELTSPPHHVHGGRLESVKTQRLRYCIQSPSPSPHEPHRSFTVTVIISSALARTTDLAGNLPQETRGRTSSMARRSFTSVLLSAAGSGVRTPLRTRRYRSGRRSGRGVAPVFTRTSRVPRHPATG